MKVLIKKGKPSGEITVPPSKSFAHRYLISEALSLKGEVKNIDYSTDIKDTISCLESLGVSLIKRFDSIEILGMSKNDNYIFNISESASTLRFFIPISLVFKDHAKFICAPKLIERGISEYESSFKDKGIKINKGKDYIELFGQLKPGTYKMRGDVSSQFISGLLFSLPLLNGDSRIEIEGALESLPYINMTLEVLKKYGINILYEANSFFINGNQKYHEYNPIVEGDYSNASFLDAFNYFGGDVKLMGLNVTSTQGDIKYREFFDMLKKAKATIDISNNIDLGPVLMVFSSLNHGSTLTGTKRLRIKESRRDMALKEELKKIGVNVTIKENSVTISKYNGNYDYMEFDSHNDHRVLMSLSLLSLFMDVRIDKAECINKSYPNYFKDLVKLGFEVSYEE